MDKQKTTYTGRFSGSAKPAKEEAVPRRVHAAPPRTPSGFASAGQAPRHSAARPAEARQPEPAKGKAKKTRPENAKRSSKKKFSWMRLLTGGLIVILVGLILIVVFGDRGTYHQMPTITREEPEGSFAPVETPLPGVEEAI